MKKQKIAIIIDPWEIKSFLVKLFYFTSDQRKLLNAVKCLIDQKKEEIDTVVIASYDNIPAMKEYFDLPIDKIYTVNTDIVLSMIEKNNINGIYFCGMSWDRCVKNRDLGYENLYKILKDKGVDILVKKDCVIASSEHKFEIFNPNNPMNKDWKPTAEVDIFKYIPDE